METKNNNMELYEALRAVPKEAQKEIGAGRLKGMTDINPMWRIKALTETFGPCGFGWKYTIDRQWLETGDKETAAFCNITLYVKWRGEWSEGIPATGGSHFLSNERSGLYMSDECYKMALTDAISVACKALGVGANVYWDKDKTKYTAVEEPKQEAKKPKADPKRDEYLKIIAGYGTSARIIDKSCVKRYGKVLNELSVEELAEVAELMKVAANASA